MKRCLAFTFRNATLRWKKGETTHTATVGPRALRPWLDSCGLSLEGPKMAQKCVQKSALTREPKNLASGGPQNPKPRTQPLREVRNPKPTPCGSSETRNPKPALGVKWNVECEFALFDSIQTKYMGPRKKVARVILCISGTISSADFSTILNSMRGMQVVCMYVPVSRDEKSKNVYSWLIARA